MVNLVMVMMAMMTMMSTTSAVHSVSGIPPAAACPPASHHEDDDGFHDNELDRRTGTPTEKSRKIRYKFAAHWYVGGFPTTPLSLITGSF